MAPLLAAAIAAPAPAEAVERDGGALEGVYDAVHSYRELGHLVAHLNPLAPKPESHPLLEPSDFGFAEERPRPGGRSRQLSRLRPRARCAS